MLVADSRLCLAREAFEAIFQEHETFRDGVCGPSHSYLPGTIISDKPERASIDLFRDGEDDPAFGVAPKPFFSKNIASGNS